MHQKTKRKMNYELHFKKWMPKCVGSVCVVCVSERCALCMLCVHSAALCSNCKLIDGCAPTQQTGASWGQESEEDKEKEWKRGELNGIIKR